MCRLLPYAIDIYHLRFLNTTFKTFLIFGSIPFFIFFFNLVSMNSTEWSTIPACPSFMCSFDRGSTEGTNFSKICVDVCVCMFCIMFA